MAFSIDFKGRPILKHIALYKIVPNPHQPRKIFDAEALRQTLNIPEEQSVVSVIGLGHRIETPDRPKRKTVDVIATFHE